MINKNIKNIIAEFNFAEPRWDRLPVDFANLPTDGLTKQEKHLFEAMKLAYFTLEDGRKVVIRKLARTATISFVVLIIALSLFSSPRWMPKLSNWGRTTMAALTKPVNAATVSAQIKSGSLKAGEMIQSTVSGILRTNIN